MVNNRSSHFHTLCNTTTTTTVLYYSSNCYTTATTTTATASASTNTTTNNTTTTTNSSAAPVATYTAATFIVKRIRIQPNLPNGVEFGSKRIGILSSDANRNFSHPNFDSHFPSELPALIFIHFWFS